MSKERTHITVLAGGPDAEREVSLHSGRTIAEALRATRHFDVVYHEIDRLDASDLARIESDVFFPALHGPWGEGGPLQRLLEADGRSFVGSGSQAAALAMDKMKTKQLAEKLGFTTPPSCVLTIDDVICPLDPPLVLKPIDDGSSVDIHICHDQSQLIDARDQLHTDRDRIMAECYISGRELTVGIVCDQVNSLIEIVPTVDFYDYEAKYEREDTKFIVDPPNLSQSTIDSMYNTALGVYEAIGVRDIARVDFLLDSDGETPWFLEINTMPGFTGHSLVPMGAAAHGLPLPDLCEKLVRSAMGRVISL